MSDDFAFELKQMVKLTESSEKGTVVGRVEYTNKNNRYLVRYMAGDGRQVEDWWDEDAIEAL